MKAKIWDPLNESEDSASEYEIPPGVNYWKAVAEDLAEQYAEEDVDGGIEGTYVNGCDLTVLFDNGQRFIVTVTVEYVPRFYCNVKVPENVE